MERSTKNKENVAQNRLISDMFRVKKCLFDQSLRKDTELSSPSTVRCITASPVMESPSMEDSPFSLFKVKKKTTIVSKVSASIDYTASGSIVTTPTNKKYEYKEEEEEMEVSCVYQNSNEVKLAVQKSILNPNLTGDFSKPCILETIQGKHRDLKTVSPAMVASLFNGCVPFSFTLVDCRYPYEFEAGHIKNARNVFMKEDIVKTLLDSKATSEKVQSNEVLIFYCEFSSERGPSMLRHLRNADRDLNSDSYPFLYYPELYIMEGGYKAFFSNFKELCDPQEYKRMLDKDCAEELAYYKSKCKSSNRSHKRLKRTRSSLVF